MGRISDYSRYSVYDSAVADDSGGESHKIP